MFAHLMMQARAQTQAHAIRTMKTLQLPALVLAPVAVVVLLLLLAPTVAVAGWAAIHSGSRLSP